MIDAAKIRYISESAKKFKSFSHYAMFSLLPFPWNHRKKKAEETALFRFLYIYKRCNPFYSKDQVLSFARGCISASASSMDVWLLVASIPAGDITRMSAVGLVYASLLIACSLIVSFSLVSLYFKVLFASEHHLLAVMDVDAVLLRIVHLHALQVEVGRVRSEE